MIRISCLEGCVQKKGFTKEVCLKTGIRLVKCLKNGYYTNSRVHCYGYIILETFFLEIDVNLRVSYGRELDGESRYCE